MISKNGDMQQELIFAGGLELNKDPKVIPDHKHVLSKNMFPSVSGVLQKRPGHSVSQYINTLEQGIHAITRIFIPHPTSGYRYIFHDIYTPSASDDPITSIYASNLDNVAIESETSSQLTNEPSEAVNQDPVSFCNYRLYTVCCTKPNSIDSAHYTQAAQNSVSVLRPNIVAGAENLNAPFVFERMSFGTQSIPVNPYVCCTYKGRMRYFNFGLGMENWMVSADRVNADAQPAYFSVVEVAADCLAVDGYHVEFEQIAGERITAAFEAQLQAVGSPMESCLVVLTDKSMLICTGDVASVSDVITPPDTIFHDFTVTKVNYDVGCVSEATIAKTPYGYIWASASDVWLLAGNVPVKIGTSITPALQNTPPESRKWWTAAYCKNPGVYALDIIAAREDDDRYLRHEQYWLQLNDATMPRNADDARWFGPMVVNSDAVFDEVTTYHSGIATDFDGERIVKVMTEGGYAGDNTFYGACLIDITSAVNADDITFNHVTAAVDWEPATAYAIGDVVKGTQFNFDGQFYVALASGVSGGAEPVWANGVADGGVAWEALSGSVKHKLLNHDTSYYPLNLISFKSKEFMLGTPAVDKVIKKLDLTAFSSLPQQLSVSAISNQGAKNQSLGTPLLGQGSAFAAGIGILDSTLIANSEFEAKTARPPSLIRSKFLQVGIQDDGQIVIDATCNKLVFGFASTNTQSVEAFTATVELTEGNGKYAVFQGIDNLTSAIVAGMITAVGGQIDFLNTDLSIDSWSRIELVGGISDVVGITATGVSAIDGIAIGLLYGNSNDVTLGTRTAGVVTTATFDLAISKKLMAMLGYNTSTSSAYNLNVFTGTGPLSQAYMQVQSYPNDQGNLFGGRTPVTIWGRSGVSNRRSSKIALASGQILARLTNTSALQYTNR